MKIIRFPLFILIVAILFQSCNSEEDKIIIGANFSLTGNTALWSQELKEGMDLALSEFESQNSDLNIEIEYQDNKGKANEAVTIFNKFSGDDEVLVVVSCFTPISQPLRDLAGRKKMPLLATVTAAKDFAKDYDWVFRDFITQSQQVPPLADLLVNELGINSVSSIVVNDDYGLDGASILKTEIEKKGGTYLRGEVFEQSDLEMRNQVVKVLSDNPGALLVIGRNQSMASCVNQIRELNPNIPIVGVNSFDSEVIWNAVPEASQNDIYFTSAFVNYQEDEAASAFRKSFVKKHEKEPTYVNIYGYTIMQYLLNIVNETDGTREKIMEKLGELNFESIRGELEMNSNNEVLSPVALYKRVNNTNALVSKN